MSRSIHHTKGWGIWKKLDPSSDSHLEAQFKKSRIKQLMRIERKAPKDVFIPVSPEGIKYTEDKLEPFLFFPATLEDVRGVMAELPPGYLNGVSHIKFTTGREYINATKSINDQVLDPVLKRKSFEIEPGVFVPIVMGIYCLNSGEIQLFAYALNSTMVLSQRTELFLKVHMLQTLVHEISHNHDKTPRVARGRWRMDDNKKDEAYANRMADELMDSVVFPYVRRLYRRLYGSKSSNI